MLSKDCLFILMFSVISYADLFLDKVSILLMCSKAALHGQTNAHPGVVPSDQSG